MESYNSMFTNGEQTYVDDVATVNTIAALARVMIKLHPTRMLAPHRVFSDFHQRITVRCEAINHPTVRAAVTQDFLVGMDVDDFMSDKLHAEDMAGLYTDGIEGACQIIQDAWQQ